MDVYISFSMVGHPYPGNLDLGGYLAIIRAVVAVFLVLGKSTRYSCFPPGLVVFSLSSFQESALFSLFCLYGVCGGRLLRFRKVHSECTVHFCFLLQHAVVPAAYLHILASGTFSAFWPSWRLWWPSWGVWESLMLVSRDTSAFRLGW